MRRISILILLTFTMIFSVFGATRSSFNLRHVVNVDSDYYFEFWDTESGKMISSASVEGEERNIFTTLMIIFNATAKLKSIKISFGPMTNTEDSSAVINYKMEIFKPNTATDLVSALNISTKTQTAELLSGVTTYTKYSTDTWNTDEIADFAITLSGTDSVASGNYEANITCTFTAN